MPGELGAEAIVAAGRCLEGVVRRTPLERSERLSGLVGVPVFLKREDAQVTRSFKVRGAYHLISSLSAEEKSRGVVCASAGNHGLGVAFSCAAQGIKGKVFVPSTTPRQKRQRIAAVGGPLVDLVVAGATYDQAGAAALADSNDSGAVHVHPFDDRRIIAGQGTVAMEITEQLAGEIDAVVVPVGGGGLIAGMALWLAEHRPETKVVGAEPAGAASMVAALAHGGPVDLPSLDVFVEGAAVGRVGRLTYPVVRQAVEEVVKVPEGAVCTEMLDLYQSEGVIAEPAGALASAAARRFLPRRPEGPVVCVISGGNNDVSRYAEVIERSMLYEGLRHYFLVTFPQEPGALRRFLDTVLVAGEDIVVFEYVKKNARETGPALVGIELERAEDLEGLLSRMAACPLEIERVHPGSPLFSFLV